MLLLSFCVVLVAMCPLSSIAAPGGVVVTRDSDGYTPGDRSDPVDTLRIGRGTDLTYLNLHAVPHNVTSEGKKPNGSRLFASPTAVFGQAVDVVGVKDLAPGSYDFICSIHPGMKGRLVVV